MLHPLFFGEKACRHFAIRAERTGEIVECGKIGIGKVATQINVKGADRKRTGVELQQRLTVKPADGDGVRRLAGKTVFSIDHRFK
ncbi:hypothetical protein D9M69_635640 [compost metagenome]